MGTVGQIARGLQPLVERQDRLRGNRRAQRGDVPAAHAALQAIDARPFADVVAVRGAAVEHMLLQAAHDGLADGILLAVGMRRAEFDVKAGGFEQSFLDGHDDWKVEHLVVRRDADDGLGHGLPTIRRFGARGAV